jgi:hypothetical protein
MRNQSDPPPKGEEAEWFKWCYGDPVPEPPDVDRGVTRYLHELQPETRDPCYYVLHDSPHSTGSNTQETRCENTWIDEILDKCRDLVVVEAHSIVLGFSALAGRPGNLRQRASFPDGEKPWAQIDGGPRRPLPIEDPAC